jgi:phospholipase/lecithinase/hemolysin
MRAFILRSVVGCATSLTLAISAQAAAYTGLYAFGDSLSDTGNIYALSGGATPLPPYYQGQYSNGNVWLQSFASNLGLAPLTPSLTGGTDYAYGGAQSGTTPFHTANLTDVVGTTGQLAQFKTAHPVADPGALYVIWIGGNDLLGIPSNATAAQVQALAASTIGNIDTAVSTLAADGATKFLVMTLPDVGKTPEALAGGPIAAATASAVAASFNNLLLGGNAGAGIPSLSALAAGLGVNVNVFNAYSFLDGVVANPAAYGLTNVTTPCFNGTTVCANPDQYLFWDSVHPTAAAHVALGNAVAAAVPEPAQWAMLVAGLALLALGRRRQH